MTFAGGRKCVGTGFMISENIMVTAAHCVYRKSRRPLGPAHTIEACFGYENGNLRERRYGEVVLTSKEWMDRGSDPTRDIAVVRLSPRSTYSAQWPLRPFQPAKIDSPDEGWLFVVGHPTDRGDGGKNMQEGSGYVRWDFSGVEQRLPYDISTHRGKFPPYTFQSALIPHD